MESGSVCGFRLGGGDVGLHSGASVLTVQGVLLSGEKVRVSGGQRVPGAQGCSTSVAETTHTQ